MQRCLAIDLGSERVGMAFNVGSLVLAKEAIPRSSLVEWLQQHSTEYEVILFGLPLNLDGSFGIAAKSVITAVEEIQNRLQTPIRFVDERLSTVVAQRRLREVGLNSKNSRDKIDSEAAVEILKQAILENPEYPGRDLDDI
jgi:putative Holliday junction resolvase